MGFHQENSKKEFGYIPSNPPYKRSYEVSQTQIIAKNPIHPTGHNHLFHSTKTFIRCLHSNLAV